MSCETTSQVETPDGLPTIPARIEELRLCAADAGRVERAAGVGGDVGPGAPARRVQREYRVLRVLVADVQQRPGKALRVIGIRLRIGIARAGHAGGHAGRAVAAMADGALLDETPEVRLDHDESGLAERANLLHQQRPISIVGVHGAGAVEVRQIVVALAAARWPVRLRASGSRRTTA